LWSWIAPRIRLDNPKRVVHGLVQRRGKRMARHRGTILLKKRLQVPVLHLARTPAKK
jgi:hypothetical protein